MPAPRMEPRSPRRSPLTLWHGGEASKIEPMATKKNPPQCCREGSLVGGSVGRIRDPDRSHCASVAHFARNDLAEKNPGIALKLLQLLLLDRIEVGRRRVDLDPRQQQAEFEVLEAGG